MNFDALKKIIYILFSFLIIILFSCVRNDTIVFEQIVGRYQNSDSNAVDGHYLTIRSDSTYTYLYCPKFGDIFLYYHGKWQIEQNNIVLYEGVDFAGDLNVQEVRDYNADTLKVNFSESLDQYIPNLNFYIDDRVLDKPSKNQLLINKKDYWIQIHDIIDSAKYQYASSSLFLRQGNFFAEIPYVFENREINISLKNNKLNDNRAVLTKYYLKDSVLCSVNESYNVERHKLKRKNGANH